MGGAPVSDGLVPVREIFRVEAEPFVGVLRLAPGHRAAAVLEPVDDARLKSAVPLNT